MCSLNCCGLCCGGFSFFCMIFLIVVGGVLDSGSHSIHIPDDKRASAVDNCYVGAAIYAGCIGASILMWLASKWLDRKPRGSTPLLQGHELPN